MAKTLRTVLSSLSLSRANRVGSDDKIARLASPVADQWDPVATACCHWASVEQLRQELEAKERMIGELQKRLQAQSLLLISDPGEERGRRVGPLAQQLSHRKSRSLIARSASIISRKSGKLAAGY